LDEVFDEGITADYPDALQILEKTISNIYKSHPKPETVKLFDIEWHTKS